MQNRIYPGRLADTVPFVIRKGDCVTEEKFESCIRAMNSGQKEGLHEIYQEYLPYIYGIVRGMLASREEAEDVTSDFFIRLWEKSDTYKKGNGHKGWMATIARNMAVDHIRKRKREILTDFSEHREGEKDEAYGAFCAEVQAVAAMGSTVATPEEQVVGDMSISEAMALLKESEREVGHLKIMGDMTFQEIADILQTPLGTVAWRYREAIKKIRRCGYEGSGTGI